MTENSKDEEAAIAEFEIELIRNHLILTPEKLKIVRQAARNLKSRAEQQTASAIFEDIEKIKRIDKNKFLVVDGRATDYLFYRDDEMQDVKKKHLEAKAREASKL